MSEDFVHRQLLGKRVHRLGISVGYGLDEPGLRAALDLGINYLFAGTTKRAMHAVLRDVVAKDRERFVLASGPMFGYFAGSVRRALEKVLREAKTDYLDVLQLFWAGKMSALTPAVIAEMVKLKEEGKARAIGISIHDRVRAGRLAEEGPLDFFMLRYNAAHPGAEQDIFPHLERRKPLVTAYTATSWGKLLTPPKGWEGPAATAGDCYRFCLSSPHVDVTLTGPKSLSELQENLRALEKGPLSVEEDTRLRALGRAVHG